MSQDDDLYSELGFYTLAHRDPAFIHQVAVDAYTAQSANEATKPIALVFALVGFGAKDAVTPVAGRPEMESVTLLANPYCEFTQM